MKKVKRAPQNITRRSFLGMLGTSVATAGVAGSGLAGCTPQSSSGTKQSEASDKTSSELQSWEIAPDPIDESMILETYESEVIVIGAGTSGLCAALAAGEAGLDTIVLNKTGAPSGFATGTAVWEMQHQKEIGLAKRMNAIEYTSQWMKACSNVPNRNFMNMWMNRSGADVDWILQYMQPEGLTEWMDDTLPEALMIDWVTGAAFLESKAKEFGVEFFHNTPAVQIEREEAGRVTSVIAQTADDEYKRFKASKGIIICAGDYNGDEEMVKHFIPWANGFKRSQPANVNMGDMLKAAHWVGAAIDSEPHSCEIHYGLYFFEMEVPMGSGIPWLYVNARGERFCNEDVEYQYVPFQDIEQPGCMHFDIFDDNFETDWLKMGDGAYRNYPTYEECFEGLHEWIEKYDIDEQNQSKGRSLMQAYEAFGTVYIADTLEELAQKCGIEDVDTFLTTVERYNTLSEMGVDEDYGKTAEHMPAIKQAPFYAIPRQSYMLSCLGGLTVNTSMEVLDEEKGAIPGLYAAGLAAGGRWFGGMVQPMDYWAGLPSSQCLVTARVAVETLIANEA